MSSQNQNVGATLAVAPYRAGASPAPTMRIFCQKKHEYF